MKNINKITNVKSRTYNPNSYTNPLTKRKLVLHNEKEKVNTIDKATKKIEKKFSMNAPHFIFFMFSPLLR